MVSLVAKMVSEVPLKKSVPFSIKKLHGVPSNGAQKVDLHAINLLHVLIYVISVTFTRNNAAVVLSNLEKDMCDVS